jgi:hypothetical protein
MWLPRVTPFFDGGDLFLDGGFQNLDVPFNGGSVSIELSVHDSGEIPYHLTVGWVICGALFKLISLIHHLEALPLTSASMLSLL